MTLYNEFMSLLVGCYNPHPPLPSIIIIISVVTVPQHCNSLGGSVFWNIPLWRWWQISPCNNSLLVLDRACHFQPITTHRLFVLEQYWYDSWADVTQHDWKIKWRASCRCIRWQQWRRMPLVNIHSRFNNSAKWSHETYRYAWLSTAAWVTIMAMCEGMCVGVDHCCRSWVDSPVVNCHAAVPYHVVQRHTVAEKLVAIRHCSKMLSSSPV